MPPVDRLALLLRVTRWPVGKNIRQGQRLGGQMPLKHLVQCDGAQVSTAHHVARPVNVQFSHQCGDAILPIAHDERRLSPDRSHKLPVDDHQTMIVTLHMRLNKHRASILTMGHPEGGDRILHRSDIGRHPLATTAVQGFKHAGKTHARHRCLHLLLAQHQHVVRGGQAQCVHHRFCGDLVLLPLLTQGTVLVGRRLHEHARLGAPTILPVLGARQERQVRQPISRAPTIKIRA